MKSRKRALRRHHRQRMIARALKSYVLSGERDPVLLRERALRWYDHLKRCSCYMCGNPRKFEGRLPVQEQRIRHAAELENAQLLQVCSKGPYLPERQFDG